MKVLYRWLFTVLTVFALCRVANAEPVRIRLAWIAPISNWGSLLLEKKELARHLGQSYLLEPVRYSGSSPMINALANGELEIADLAFSTLPIAIQNAGLDDLRVVASELEDGVPGFYSQEYMVRIDGTIKTVEDLKDRVVASLSAGTAVDIGIRAMLRRHGLENQRDYTIVETPLPAMRSMLVEKKVDLIAAVPPFSFDPELRRIARPLFVHREVSGETQLLIWTARKGFIDRNRAAMVDLMEDSLRITHWYLDPANHQEVMEICGRITKQPPERYDWVFTERDYYRDPDMQPELGALQKNVDLVKDLGFFKGDVDVSKYADLGILREAIARLK
jgi:sulfonate transport system substrate-binding protein